MMDGLGTPSRLVAAANFDGWTVTALSIGAGERRHLLVENDALGDYEYEVSYACAFEGDETTGCCSRSAPQLRRLAAALVQDVPGAIVPPLGLAAAAGCEWEAAEALGAQKDWETAEIDLEQFTALLASKGDDDLGDGKGGKTTDEVRRQRRMLSNRESARRSRRRKLEHVSVLEGQINGHKAENIALLERLRESEARVEAVVRENAQLKAEIVRMSEVGGGASGKPMERASSLQRIASAGNLAKSNLGGTASPQMSGDDSPRGFVPFRSLQSYENLLSLQAQGR